MTVRDSITAWVRAAVIEGTVCLIVRRIVHFTVAEGAAGHCEPMARGLAAQRFFDFLDDHVG